MAKTIVTQDELFAQAMIKAAEEGSFKVQCADSRAAYLMRFRIYGFIKRLRKGTTGLSPALSERAQEAVSNVMVLVQEETGSVLLQNRFDDPSMAALKEALGASVEEVKEGEAREMKEMSERLLGQLAPAPSNKYLDLIKPKSDS